MFVKIRLENNLFGFEVMSVINVSRMKRTVKPLLFVIARVK
jgi:hypothetical protein